MQEENNFAELKKLYIQQKEGFIKHPYPDYSSRIKNLKSLRKLLVNNQDNLIAAIGKDYGIRSADETKVMEIFPSLQSIDYAIKNLKAWMRVKTLKTPIWFWPSKNLLYPQPKGVVGIIVPWNYPLFLTISPLVSALAAGNRVMIKLSEYSPNISSLIQKLFKEIFLDSKVLVITGDAKVAEEFCNLPFDHLFFTGSTNIGKKVMRAASNNLVPVTLELGGKSPALLMHDEVCEQYIDNIWFGKLLNSGQTCIAPDYVWAPVNHNNQIVSFSKNIIKARIAKQGLENFTSIINQEKYNRILSLIDDAIAKDGTWHPLMDINTGSTTNIKDWHTSENNIYRISPGLILQANHTMAIMQEEIFGPVLPIMEYDSIIQLVYSMQVIPSPLVIYLFTTNNNKMVRFIESTSSGAMSINATIVHAAQESLPFGGYGHSGMGAYRGKYGFDTFSLLKPIYKQSKINIFNKFYPLTGKKWQKMLLNYLLK